MNDPVRDSMRPTDQPTEAGWRAIERRIKRRRVLRAGAGLAAAAVLAALVIWRVSAPRENSQYVYLHVSTQLERMLRANRAPRRPEIIVIDNALAQAEQALATDPANEYVIRSINRLKNQRLTALRDACYFYC